MQTTLLGLAIAIILAIVAALVAPFVVDWNHYRSAFETEASRLTGMSVRVNGSIDARILPTPLITLRNVEAGAAGQPPQLRAGSLELEVGLGPLLRGEVQASQVHLVAPQLSIGLDRSGAIDWPAPASSFRPEALSVSHFNVVDGRIILSDAASGSHLMLDKVSFDGDIRSFFGPFSGDGTFAVGNDPYAYRLSGSRTDDHKGFKIRLGLDPSNHPLTADIDGVVTMDRGQPHFDGALALTRPVGAALSSGQRVLSDPWRAGGQLRATPAAATLRDMQFQYGPDERALNFTGTAALTFGAQPHLDGTVSAMQLNVDRALANPDLTHRPPLLVIKSFLQSFAAIARPAIPAAIGVSVDAVTVGGTAMRSLHGTMHFDGADWTLNDFKFQAPGLTQVDVSGRLADTPQGFAFSGPAALQSADVDMLLAWLRGGSAQPTGQAKTLSAQGNVTIGGDRMAVDGLTASLDRENIEGKFAYTWAAANRPAALDAELHAATLDLDAIVPFGTAAADYGLELPHAGSLVLDIGKATSAGVDAQKVDARIKFDAGALQIDELSIGELGGAALNVSGRIEDLSSHPRGQITLDLDAAALNGLMTVVGKFAPRAAGSLRHFADRLAPAKVHATLDIEPATTAASTAKLDLSGQVGALRISLDGVASGAPNRLGDATVRIKSRLDADDATALAALVGLDRVVALDPFPGSITLSAVGPLNGNLQVEGQVAASGIAAAVSGPLRLLGDNAPAGNLQVQVSAADLRPLAQAMTGQPGTAVPFAGHAAVSIAGSALSFTDMSVTAGKSTLRGHLKLDVSSPMALDGDIAGDAVDGARMAALLLGVPRAVPGANTSWSSDPLGAGAFTAMNGALRFKFDRAVFTPALVAQDLKGVVHFHPSEIALDDLDGKLAGGQVAGELAFRRNAGTLDAHGNIELGNADAATIFGADSNTLDGRLTIKLQCDSIGATPNDLVQALNGKGEVALTGGRFGGIDPAAFAAATRLADQGTIDAAKIQAAVGAAMANGRLVLPQAAVPVTITGGKLGIANATLPVQGDTDLVLTGALDVATAAIDARLTLKRHPRPSDLIAMPPQFVVALRGPLASPVRTLDTSALTSWLSLRAAELQARRLESIQANQRAENIGPTIRPDSPVVRGIPSGVVVETAMPASAVPGLGARGLERLQPRLPSPTTGGGVPAPAEQKPKPAPSPQATAPQSPPPPQGATPPRRSLLDLLFGSKN